MQVGMTGENNICIAQNCTEYRIGYKISAVSYKSAVFAYVLIIGNIICALVKPVS